MSPDEQLRDRMRRKTAALRPGCLTDCVSTSIPATSRGPFSCRQVFALLVVASVLCIVVWLATLSVCAMASATSVVSSTAALVVSYLVLVGLCAAAYTAILRRSAWFFYLRPSVRWLASFGSAIILMVAFTFVFQIAFTLFAGW